MENHFFKAYLDTLLSQIREKRARELVRNEIKAHLDDQKAAYMADGMSEPQAAQAAVSDMGDPIETGAALDRIHRPKPAWGMLAVIAVLCAFGIFLQYLISVNGQAPKAEGLPIFQKHFMCAVTGFALLCAVYLLDYTRIAVYSGWLCRLMLLFVLLLESNMIPPVPSAPLTEFLLYLYVPLYGALLYTYRNAKKPFWPMMVIYTILPLLLAQKSGKTILLLNLTAIFLFLIATAAIKGWFGLSKKKIRLAVAGVLALAAGIPIFSAFWLRAYQSARFYAWLHPETEPFGPGYIGSQIRAIVNGSKLIGSYTAQPIAEILPELSADFSFTFLIGSCGILAASALVLLILLFGIRMLHISLHQKNQLGLIMGLGCSLVFGIQSAESILVNLSLLPSTSAYFPLISYSQGGMLQTCILLGILLSIYRYQDVVSEPTV